ncbi:MAG: ABC transporter permease subunit, partial [Acetobacteraceae bacterium]
MLSEWDSFAALALQYTGFDVPFVCYVLKSFFGDIDPALEESALVNGATRWRAFRQIAVPLTRPEIIAVALLAFIFSWNEFFFAVILTRARVTTLPVILSTLMEGHDVRCGAIAAIATLAALPWRCWPSPCSATWCAACPSAPRTNPHGERSTPASASASALRSQPKPPVIRCNRPWCNPAG